jgi:hypothetical protein
MMTTMTMTTMTVGALFVDSSTVAGVLLEAFGKLVVVGVFLQIDSCN